MNSHFVYQQEATSDLWAKQCYIAAEISQLSREQGYHATHESDVTEPHPMECQDLALTSQERKYRMDSYAGMLDIAPHQLQLETLVNITSHFSDEYTVSHTPTNPSSNSLLSSNEFQNLNMLAQPASLVPFSPPSPPVLHKALNASQPAQVIQSLQSCTPDISIRPSTPVTEFDLAWEATFWESSTSNADTTPHLFLIDSIVLLLAIFALFRGAS
jgi:hypothetical protein